MNTFLGWLSHLSEIISGDNISTVQGEQVPWRWGGGGVVWGMGGGVLVLFPYNWMTI